MEYASPANYEMRKLTGIKYKFKVCHSNSGLFLSKFNSNKIDNRQEISNILATAWTMATGWSSS
uniref:Uncharacterized protein n=1 Tax=Romanomermis culicivorax TaxID=13658 RepID=A0A915I8C7_ROMCU